MPNSGPSKFTEARQNLWLRLIAKGVSRNQAAKRCGVTVGCVIKHKQAHPEFLERELEAEEEFCYAVENLYKKCMFKKGDYKAMQWFLANRNSKRWQMNKRPSIVMNVTKPVSIEDLEKELLSMDHDIQGKTKGISENLSPESPTVSPPIEETEVRE